PGGSAAAALAARVDTAAAAALPDRALVAPVLPGAPRGQLLHHQPRDGAGLACPRPYSPFFLSQIRADHVKEITSKGTAVQGVFTRPIRFEDKKATTKF